MPKKPRSSDGTMRRANTPKVLTNRSIIARWVEGETLHLKRLGMSFQAIADHIVEVAHGRQKAMVHVPQDAQFPEHYQISMQAVHRAFKRAIDRLPNAEAGELRKLDSERLEEMFLSLQPGIRQGPIGWALCTRCAADFISANTESNRISARRSFRL